VKRTAPWIACGILAVASWGCSIHQRTRTAIEESGRTEPRSVCVLFFDGLPDDTFSTLLAAGALPNLGKVVIEPGLRVRNAVASVPSETYPNLAAVLTGLLPGHHGIPANVWLDRRLHRRESHTNIFRSYAAAEFLAPEARTLYERLPATSVALTAPIFRGATVAAKNAPAIVASYLRNDWAFLDRKTLDDVGDAYAGASDAGTLPSLVFAHLVGTDEVAHDYGPDGPEFRKQMESTDRAFGRLVRRLARRKALNRILFVIIADHGNSPYQKPVEVEEIVHRALFSHPSESDCREDGCVVVPVSKGKEGAYDVGDAEIAVGAYRGAMIWLPGSRPLEDLPTVFRTARKKRPRPVPPARPRSPMPNRYGFAAALARRQEIRLVVTRGERPGEVHVYGPTGEALIVTDEQASGPDLYTYRVVDGDDPLGYGGLEEVGTALGTGHTADWWLHATARSEAPDLVVQLSEFFDSPRSPDVYITPAPGYGFKLNRSAGHGSLARRETVVPLVFAGPGIAPGTLEAARTVDLAPTLLRYLGVPFDPEEMDGVDLAIEHPERSPGRKIAP
jgi:arylsulfatase A-like enzyme